MSNLQSPEPELPIEHAATVLVLRDTPSGLQVLLMRRASELAFHGGAWVFPGGRVDPADKVETGDPHADALATARRAAVREAHEEAGLTLAADALVTVSHWTTPKGRPRRFATWFFAVALDTPAEVVVDGAEISTHRWLRPGEALSARERGELELPPPTFVTLSMLRAFSSVQSLLSHLRAHEPPIYVPRPRVVAHGVYSLYQGDAAYDGAELDAPGPRHRLHMLKGGWRYERSS